MLVPLMLLLSCAPPPPAAGLDDDGPSEPADTALADGSDAGDGQDWADGADEDGGDETGDPPMNPPYEQDLVLDGSFESFDM